MERTQTWIDKSAWGEGAWQSEPDKVQWTDTATGYPCLIVRNPSHGALCGYVGVPEGHPRFRSYYNEVEEVESVELTFSGFCQEEQEHGICHVPEPGAPERVWWLGFDCAHANDISPAYHAWSLKDFSFASYKDIIFVKEMVAQLASELKQHDLTTV